MTRGRLIATSALLLVLGSAPAVADDTGGSMGGGDWSGGGDSSGGGSYSSGDSSSSYSSSDYSSNDNYSYSSNDPGTGGSGHAPPALVLLLLGGVAFAVVARAALRRPSQFLALDTGGASVPATPWNPVDVTVLRVALDGRSRAFVQAELARIGKVADTATAEGRATLLREVALLLRRVRDTWLYGGAVNEPMTSLEDGRQRFQAHVDDARGRFTHELVRNEQGVVTTAPAPHNLPTSDEGIGVVLVNLIVAARTELFTVSRIGDGEELRKALESLSNRTARDIVAIEIVWQPADADDRLSSIELEAKYPHPQLVKLPAALAGKVFCSYCGGPYPAELLACPHCGGRAAA